MVTELNQLQGQLSLDERKFVQEIELRKAEIALKEREIAVKEREGKSRWSSPTTIGLFVAAIALAGNIFVAFMNGRNSGNVERSREQADLILQAVHASPEQACGNLIALIKLGLVKDPTGKMQTCRANPDVIPILPAATYAPVSDTSWSTQMSTEVKRIPEGDNYRFDVTFRVPPPPSSPYPFNLVNVYAYKLDPQGVRSEDQTLPPLHGNWRPGDQVRVSAILPRNYVDDASHKVYLRFCVGSDAGCLPGPDLLLPRRQ